MDVCIAEIKATGVQGALGLDQMDWGDNKFYEIWKVSPCCGEPDAQKALYCIGSWWCCGPCSFGKLFAASVGEDCAIVPHCLCGMCPCGPILLRYNLRKKSGTTGNCIGDCVCTACCGPCSFCQILRSVSVNEWALTPWKSPEIVAPNATKVIR